MTSGIALHRVRLLWFEIWYKSALACWLFTINDSQCYRTSLAQLNLYSTTDFTRAIWLATLSILIPPRLRTTRTWPLKRRYQVRFVPSICTIIGTLTLVIIALHDIVKASKTAMLTTRASDGHLHSRAMNPAGRASSPFLMLTTVLTTGSISIRGLTSDLDLHRQ